MSKSTRRNERKTENYRKRLTFTGSIADHGFSGFI